MGKAGPVWQVEETPNAFPSHRQACWQHHLLYTRLILAFNTQTITNWTSMIFISLLWHVMLFFGKLNYELKIKLLNVILNVWKSYFLSYLVSCVSAELSFICFNDISLVHQCHYYCVTVTHFMSHIQSIYSYMSTAVCVLRMWNSGGLHSSQDIDLTGSSCERKRKREAVLTCSVSTCAACVCVSV